MANNKRAIEKRRMESAIERFCQNARKFGLVIDPSSVALELRADSADVTRAAWMLSLLSEANKMGLTLGIDGLEECA